MFHKGKFMEKCRLIRNCFIVELSMGLIGLGGYARSSLFAMSYAASY